MLRSQEMSDKHMDIRCGGCQVPFGGAVVQVSVISVASRPGMRPKWRMLAVPTRQPADIAVAATMLHRMLGSQPTRGPLELDEYGGV